VSNEQYWIDEEDGKYLVRTNLNGSPWLVEACGDRGTAVLVCMEMNALAMERRVEMKREQERIGAPAARAIRTATKPRPRRVSRLGAAVAAIESELAAQGIGFEPMNRNAKPLSFGFKPNR